MGKMGDIGYDGAKAIANALLQNHELPEMDLGGIGPSMKDTGHLRRLCCRITRLLG